MGSKSKAICLITFSNNYDHQTAVYSMFNELKDKIDIYTIGIKNPKAAFPNTKMNYLVDCPKRPGITRKTFDLAVIKKIAALIDDIKADIVYFESVHTWNLLLILMMRHRVEFYSTVHDVNPHDSSRAVLTLQKLLCKVSNKVVVKSENAIAVASKVYGIPEDKVMYMPLWHKYPEYDAPVSSRTFLFFGRIKEYKGIEFLPDIARSCPKANFIVAGAPDDFSAQYVNALERYENVTLYPEEVDSSTMNRVFHESSWSILPYRSATQSGVIVDSYERSRPVIAFDAGCLSEQIIDGETGFLIENQNLNDFIYAINAACDFNSDEISCFSRKAYEYGFQKYSSQSAAQMFVEHLALKG